MSEVPDEYVFAAWRAVLYADSFSFPLTSEELQIWGVGTRIPTTQLTKVTSILMTSGKILQKEGYFYLRDHTSRHVNRKQRLYISNQK